MNRSLVFFSTGRSGYHAVMNWIAHQMGGAVLDNHCYGVGTAETPVWRGGLGRCMRQVSLGGIYNQRNHFYSIEQFDLQEFPNLGLNGESIVFIILRDPFNYAASCLYRRHHKSKELPKNIESFCYLKRWLQHARECAKRTNFVPGAKFLSFNHWFSDAGYRKVLARSLELECTETGLDEVPRFGGGSSFDSFDYDMRGRRMQVLDRWRYFQECDWFWGIFKNEPELVELSEQLLGFNPMP